MMCRGHELLTDQNVPSTRDLVSFSYRSIAKLRDPIQGIAEIYEKGQARNRELGVTSLLLFGGQYFIQTIEGSFDNVRMLFMKILDDPRHVDVIPFGISRIDTRSFPRWNLKLVGPDATARIIPDMDYFDFSDEALRDVHSAAKTLTRKYVGKRPYLNFSPVFGDHKIGRNVMQPQDSICF